MTTPDSIFGNLSDPTIGALLLTLGVALLIAEMFVTSFGLLGIGGLALFLIGAHYAFVGQALWVAWGIAATIAIFMGVCALTVLRSYKARQIAGIEGMIGHNAEILEWNDRQGLVRINGELWQASSVHPSPYQAGDKVVISGNEDLILRTHKPE